jgi:hypothetical protein
MVDFSQVPSNYVQLSEHMIYIRRLMMVMLDFAEHAREQTRLVYGIPDHDADNLGLNFSGTENVYVFESKQLTDSAYWDGVAEPSSDPAIDTWIKPMNWMRSFMIQHLTHLRLNIQHAHDNYETSPAYDIRTAGLSDYAKDYPTTFGDLLVTQFAMRTINSELGDLEQLIAYAKRTVDREILLTPYDTDKSLLDPFADEVLYDIADSTPDANGMTGTSGVAHWMRKRAIVSLQGLVLRMNSYG